MARIPPHMGIHRAALRPSHLQPIPRGQATRGRGTPLRRKRTLASRRTGRSSRRAQTSRRGRRRIASTGRAAKEAVQALRSTGNGCLAVGRADRLGVNGLNDGRRCGTSWIGGEPRGEILFLFLDVVGSHYAAEVGIIFGITVGFPLEYILSDRGNFGGDGVEVRRVHFGCA